MSLVPARAARLLVLAVAVVAAGAGAQPAAAGWRTIANPAWNPDTLEVCRDGVRMQWAVGGPSPIDPAVAGQAWPFRLAASVADVHVWNDVIADSLVLERLAPIPYGPLDLPVGPATEHREYHGRIHARFPGGKLAVGTVVSLWANAGQFSPQMTWVTSVPVANCLVGAPPAPSKAKCFGLVPTLKGTTHDDVLVGTPGRDVIMGLDGADRIVGRGGNDVLCGGAGRDRVLGGDGLDTIDGGPAADALLAGPGADRVFGGAGNDELRGGLDDDTLAAGDGADVVLGDAGVDYIYPEDGADTARGGPGADVLILGLGADRGFGGAEAGDADLVFGRMGDDRIALEGGADTVDGGAGADWLDVLVGGAAGGVFLDLAAGTVGWTTPVAGPMRAFENVQGGPGDDVLRGDGFPNRLVGGVGSDYADGRGGLDACGAETRVDCEQVIP